MGLRACAGRTCLRTSLREAYGLFRVPLRAQGYTGSPYGVTLSGSRATAWWAVPGPEEGEWPVIVVGRNATGSAFQLQWCWEHRT